MRRNALQLLILVGMVVVASLGAHAAQPLPQVTVTPKDGGYQVSTPIYKARVGRDGNLQSLKINGVEFLDDRDDPEETLPGASYYVDKSIVLPQMTLTDSRLTASDPNTYSVTYDFAASFFTLKLHHKNPAGAAFVVMGSSQIAYAVGLNMSQEMMAAAPADCDWPDVRLLSATGEALEITNGTCIWGRKIGRQVWERSNIAPRRDYTITFTCDRGVPPKPTISQLTRMSVALDPPGLLGKAGTPVGIVSRFENNSNDEVSAEMALRVESTLGEVVFAQQQEFTCRSHEAYAPPWPPLNLTKPDFYTITCTVTLDAATPKVATAAFGYDVGAIAPAATKPDDLDGYWDGVVKQALAAPVTVSMVEMPTRSTQTVTVYRIDIAADGRKCYGWLSVPKFPGRYPGLLFIPAERVRFIRPNETLANYGCVVLTIEPTEQPVDAYITPLIYKAFIKPDAKMEFGFRDVMINYLRAISALQSKELSAKVDANRIAVTGVGLGGAFSLLLGALDERVQAVAADVPSFCSIEMGSDKPSWPYTTIIPYLPTKPAAREEALQTLRYYDVANMTGRITCPVLISAGVSDPLSRPAMIYGVFNKLPGPKDLKLYNAGHEGGGIAHWEEKMRWLTQVLGGPGPALAPEPDKPAAAPAEAN